MQNKILKVLILIIMIIFVGWLCFFIGLDFALETLLLVMVIDYILGISLAITGNSKHGDGKLSSKIGYKGLVKKINIVLLVGLAVIIENYLIAIGIQVKYIKDITIIAFIVNESISIIENSKSAGLDIINIITKVIDILNNIKLNKKDKK